MKHFPTPFAFLIALCATSVMSFGSPTRQLPERLERLQMVLTSGAEDGLSTDPFHVMDNAKCGLWLSLEALHQWGRMTHSTRDEVASLLQAPDRQKQRRFDHFTIFYDTLGGNEPFLLDANFDPIPDTYEAFVDSVGSAFEETWRIEVEVLGYSAPPLETDGTYHVYISELGFGFYGLTTIDPPVPINASGALRYRTYIEVENDFSSVYAPSRGIPGLKVTAAHEFHHAIQLGAYGTWDADRYFYEITSTWMEDVVFDDVNDYYQYFSNSPGRSSHFAHPEVRFTAYNGGYEYSRCIFAHFMEHRFGRDVMRSIWETMRSRASFPAMEQALSDVGSTFRQAFIEFALWNSATGPNADTSRFYPEGSHYPGIAKRRTLVFDPPSRTLQDSVEAVASVYQPLAVNGDQLLIIVSNIDVPSAWSQKSFPWSYGIATSSIAGGKHLANGLFVKLDVPDPANWHSWESVPSMIDEVFVYPNPFVARENTAVRFQLPLPVREDVHLTVLSSDLRQVVSMDVSPVVAPNSDTRIEWNGRAADGGELPSGVYFFVISVAGSEYNGKLMMLRK